MGPDKLKELEQIADSIPTEKLETFLMSKNSSVESSRAFIQLTYLVPKLHQRILDVIRFTEDAAERTGFEKVYEFCRQLCKPTWVFARELREEEERFQAHLQTLSPEEQDKAIGKMVEAEIRRLQEEEKRKRRELEE